VSLERHSFHLKLRLKPNP